jgi:hypothetical protein
LARAVYTAAVRPAGPEPMMITSRMSVGSDIRVSWTMGT